MLDFTPLRPFSARSKILLTVTAILTALSGCSLLFDDEDAAKKETRQANFLFQTGREAISRGRNQEAIEKFEELEASYPFSAYAKRVPLALAYLYYQNHEYDKVIPILDQFIRINPQHEHLDYAYYLKGLSYYYYGQSFISLLLKKDRTTRDPTPLTNAFDAFKTLHENFPNSEYTEDAKQRTILLRNMLAVYELRVAEYYFQRGAYVAVVNRIKYLLEHYEGAQHTPEGLLLLSSAYQNLKLDQLADDTLQVLNLNYPNYLKQQFGELSEKEKKSWLTNLSDWAKEMAALLNLKPKY